MDWDTLIPDKGMRTKKGDCVNRKPKHMCHRVHGYGNPFKTGILIYIYIYIMGTCISIIPRYGHTQVLTMAHIDKPISLVRYENIVRL